MRRGLTRYGDEDFSLYLRTAFIKAMGYTDDALGRPVIGVANTFSSYNACHANVPQVIEAVKRGVMLAGGLPMEFPTISLHESFAYPTSMYLRNLMAMDTEEMLRALPMDACVLIGGCDKTVPAQLMAAASVDLPAIQVVTGPMLSGTHKDERVGACTDCRRFWGEFRGGRIDEAENQRRHKPSGPHRRHLRGDGNRIDNRLHDRGARHDASRRRLHSRRSRRPPAPRRTGRRPRHENCRRRPQANGHHDPGLRYRTRSGFCWRSAVRPTASSTLPPSPGRLGIEVDMEAFDAMGEETPVLVDLKPTGQYYMDDLHRAGGMAAILRELKPLLNLGLHDGFGANFRR